MKHYSVGLGKFVKRLKQQLDMRIDMFIKHQKKNSDGGMVKTETEWMKEYLEWSKNITPMQQGILRYLVDRDGETNED